MPATKTKPAYAPTGNLFKPMDAQQEDDADQRDMRRRRAVWDAEETHDPTTSHRHAIQHEGPIRLTIWNALRVHTSFKFRTWSCSA